VTSVDTEASVSFQAIAETIDVELAPTKIYWPELEMT
jgi:hypothetical protein